MPILYETYAPAVRRFKPYRYDDLVIHDRHEVKIPIHWERNGDTRVVEISKDHLVSAKLDVEMTGYPPLGGIGGKYVVNGSEIISFIWEFWESGVTKRKLNMDVKAYLRHGKNEFTAEAWKGFLMPESSVVFTTTLHLYYEWEEGEEEPGKPKPKVFTCPVCKAEFTTEEDMLDHLKEEHPLEYWFWYWEVDTFPAGKFLLGGSALVVGLVAVPRVIDLIRGK